MGGTFDPIHTGHLVVAEEARARFGIDEVIFVPAAIPPHKRRAGIAPAEDRYAMVLLATASNPFFSVSRTELERTGPSYTIDTLREFREAAAPGTDFYFITGADAVLDILTWRDPDAIIRECRLIVASRPGYDLALVQRSLPPEFIRAIDMLAAPAIGISASEIRGRVRQGMPIRYLTAAPVEEYIRKRGLYQ